MLLFSVVLAVLSVQGVYSQCITEDDSKVDLPLTNTSLYNGQLNFTLSVFESINKAQPQGNIFFSPYSIYHALLLAYFASANHTEASLKEALKLDGDEVLKYIFDILIYYVCIFNLKLLNFISDED